MRQDRPKSGPRAAKRALGTILGSSCGILEPSWDQKCVFFLTFSNTFCKSVFWPQHRFRRHLGTQEAPTWGVKSGQERPKSGQETLKRSSRAPQSGPRRTQERPRAAQAWPKSGPRAAKSGPRATKSDPRAAKKRPRRPGTPQRTPQDPLDTPRTSAARFVTFNVES